MFITRQGHYKRKEIDKKEEVVGQQVGEGDVLGTIANFVKS